MGLSFWHLLVVLIVVLVVFGAGRLPSAMGDLGKGIRNFKAGLNGDPQEDDKPFLTPPEGKMADKPSDKNDTKPQA